MIVGEHRAIVGVSWLVLSSNLCELVSIELQLLPRECRAVIGVADR